MKADQAVVQLTKTVKNAAERGSPLRIQGSGSKFFYGRSIQGSDLDISSYSGIVSYEPTELVLTAKAGTTMEELNQVLAGKGQRFAFEPPSFASGATIGGTIACGLSGPGRPYAGSVRDHILGIKCINGKGEYLSFGGQVMKNVAGYDISRLMVGALGTLGVICEVSMKVMPVPEFEQTNCLELNEKQALEKVTELTRQPLPISAMAHDGKVLRIRLEGTESGVRFASSIIGGENEGDNRKFWADLNEQKLPFFENCKTLWRLSVSSTTPPLNLPGEWFIDWGGAQRWGIIDIPAEEVFEVAKQVGGHAEIFRTTVIHDERFTPLSKELMHYHKRLKESFDPSNIFNRGIMYGNL